MSTHPPNDLTDTWHGRFSYRSDFDEPTSFIATLKQSGALLSGTIEEAGAQHVGRRTMTSTLSGQVVGAEVTFLKTYDALIGGYDEVHYAGVLRDEGLEISGTWSIPGDLSGTFLMIRSRGLLLARSREQVEKA